MAKKTVVVTINHPPFSGNFCEEGLRTVVGVQLSIEAHQVKTVLLGDGIYFALKDMKQDDFQKYLLTMKSMKMDFYLEEESVNEKHVSRDRISDDFKIVPRKEILALLKESDHVLAL